MSSFRITTNGMFRNYRTNLYKNNKHLNDAMTTVQTERKFNSYAEDPAAASKAWRLRRSYWLTGDQIDNTNFAISKFESASQAMHSIVDGDSGNGDYGLNGILSAIKGLNGTNGSSRNALGKELVQTAQNMISVMNTKYGEEFVFAGADGKNAPFAWDGAKLLYRGVNVNLEQPKSLEEVGLSKSLEAYGLKATTDSLYQVDMETPLSEQGFADAVANDASLRTQYGVNQTWEDYLASYTGGDVNRENLAKADYNSQVIRPAYEKYQQDYMARYQASYATYSALSDEAKEAAKTVPKLSSFQDAQELHGAISYINDYGMRNGVSYEQGLEDYAKLQNMADEATYIDIGIGMKEDEDGKLIPGTAFNSAVSGLKFLGYGQDKNLAVIVRELGEIFSRADPETGYYENEEVDAPRADELLNKLHEAVQAAQDQHTQLEADAKYLNTNLDQLKLNKDQLNTQINDTERMDMAEAITEMSWAQYCYNAALRIGTNILSQSLIDYMG